MLQVSDARTSDVGPFVQTRVSKLKPRPATSWERNTSSSRKLGLQFKMDVAANFPDCKSCLQRVAAGSKRAVGSVDPWRPDSLGSVRRSATLWIRVRLRFRVLLRKCSPLLPGTDRHSKFRNILLAIYADPQWRRTWRAVEATARCTVICTTNDGHFMRLVILVIPTTAP